MIKTINQKLVFFLNNLITDPILKAPINCMQFMHEERGTLII